MPYVGYVAVDASDLDVENRITYSFLTKMMYKLLNKLFGWDYIYWQNCADQGVARVHKAIDGTVYYWRYKSIKCADIIHEYHNVMWLTCKPGKYGL